MKCPNDQATLMMTERQGIEIDYCPECRGVWLDKGELDKMIDKAPAQPAVAPVEHLKEDYRNPRDYEHKSSSSRGYHDDYRKKKRKESFLGDIFDF